MRWCNKCKEWKDENNFYKDKSKKDGLRSNCKECEKEYCKNNREKINQRRRKNRENNRKKLNQKSKEFKNSPLPYNSSSQMREEIEWYEEVRESENGNVKVKCANCPNWFEPIINQIGHRLTAINGKAKGESRLYCSNKCKEDCPVHHQIKYPKYYKPYLDREVQPELAEMVLERDEYTCIKCQRHQNEIELHCHHIEGIRWNPMESADMDTCATLCINCHKRAHSEEGCTYRDMQCSY